MEEVKELILESVNAWENYKMRMLSRSSAGVTRPSRSAQGRSNVYSQLSGLEDVVFNDFIEDDFIPQGHGQVASGSASLPDPAVLETEEQRLERERNEHDVLEALSEKKSVAGLFAVNCKSSRNVLLDSKTKRGRLRC